MKKEKISDFTLRITQSNKSQLVVVIYDMIIEYLEEAIQCHENGNTEKFIETTKKIKACIYELMSSLDTKYPIAVELMQLYLYMNRLLVKSIIKKEPHDFDAIIRMIQKLSEAFREIAKQDFSPPLMGNTQKVYAGLTYGRETQFESYVNEDNNRGFTV